MGIDTVKYIVLQILYFLGLIVIGMSVDLGTRNILDLLQFLNKTSGGFTYISGLHNDTSAIYLEDTHRNLALPNTVVQEALMLLQDNDEFTILASVKQETGDSGSIISFSSGLYRFLELESSGRRDELRLHYTHDQQIRVETFPFRLADNRWHRLALTISGNHVTLYVNCSKIYERVIQSLDKQYLAGNYLNLFIGQRNSQSAQFRGALQDVKLVTKPHGYLVQCPDQNTGCPTCAQFQALQDRVKEMYTLYQNLSIKLLQAEERISGLEQCQCLKSCHQNGTERKEGELWQLDQCTICLCRNGTIECRNVDCPPAECPHPVYRDGECCPVCLTNCYYSGKYYDHGEGLSPRVCVTCTCDNGMMVCERQDPRKTCPQLECDESEIIHIQDECCPVCKGTDFCAAGNDCHHNASCINLATRYACQCNRGFKGTGQQCEDIDECLEVGGKYGHHCHGNMKCVNTIGSYKCTCLSGHAQSDDDQSCSEIDECDLGIHGCDVNAECTNTKGSYICTCKTGYYGDGFSCHPICTGSCQNGGRCIRPNTCECRHGYIGPNCEHDIDECSLGISACHGKSACINTQGWYRCDCLEGYHSNWPDNHYGSLCMDLNECQGEGGGHTCHPTTHCINTEGGYQCVCVDEENCVKKCSSEVTEHDNGESWTSAMDKCMRCQCKDSKDEKETIGASSWENLSSGVCDQEGITACHKAECNCSAEKVDFDCCPHCDESSQCYHPDTTLTFQNGEQWKFQCETCECLKGEIDCWPVQCPKKLCSTFVQEPGDCCPRCVDDNPCLNLHQETGGADMSAYVCHYKGETKHHGETWYLHTDPCTKCECRAGHICCAFIHGCQKPLALSEGFALQPQN